MIQYKKTPGRKINLQQKKTVGKLVEEIIKAKCGWHNMDENKLPAEPKTNVKRSGAAPREDQCLKKLWGVDEIVKASVSSKDMRMVTVPAIEIFFDHDALTGEPLYSVQVKDETEY